VTTKKVGNGNIRFAIGDEWFTVDISPPPIAIQFERHFDVQATALQMAPRLEYIAFMAWAAARRAGVAVPADFDEFVNVLDDIEVIEAPKGKAPNANPTAGGQ